MLARQLLLLSFDCGKLHFFIIQFTQWYYPADFQNVFELKKVAIFVAFNYVTYFVLEEIIQNSSI
jgi:hypothetical protein